MEVSVVGFTFLPLYPRERGPGTHWIGLDAVEKRKILPCQEWNTAIQLMLN
jgi:hypothetical protein